MSLHFSNFAQNFAMRKSVLFVLSFALLSLTACGDYNNVQKTTDFDYKYEAAKQYFAEGQYNRASLMLQEVITMLKGTDKGEESLFLLGMSSFNARNYDAASAYFRKYYEAYPRGIYTEQARFYCAKALYLNTPETRLDQTATYEAVTEFNNFIEAFPASSLRDEASELIFALQDKLVEKEYLSAELYYNLGDYFGNCTNGGSNYQACIVTSENAIKDFPYTSRREDFSLLILKAKFELARQSVEHKKEERYHNAIDEYYGFVNEYPDSKYLKLANELFSKTPKQFKQQVAESEEDEQTTNKQ